MAEKREGMEVLQKNPNGKLVRIEFSLVRGVLRNVRITGDFFLHPEEAITRIESALEGCKPNEIARRMEEILEKTGATIIGVEPRELERAVVRATSDRAA